MQIVKITTYSRDSKGNVSGKKETFFADRAKALEFAKSDGRVHGSYPGDESHIGELKNGHFWGDEQENTFAAFDITGETGDKITQYAEISFHKLN